MLLIKRIFIFLVLWVSTVNATPNVLNATTHADEYINQAANAAIGVTFTVDYNPSGTASSMPTDITNSGGSYFAVGTTTPVVNHAPYSVANASLCKFLASLDIQSYSVLLAANATYTIPVGVAACGALPVGTAPGILLTAVSASNSGDGGTGWGVEFALSPSYLGLDTSADSWVSAEMAGFYAAMSYQHPTWNFFDIKGAFRQTAANWATGYSSSSYGYGVLSYSAATAVSGTATVYLQPPGINVVNHSNYLTITLLPFRQTRRAREVLYSVSSSYSWPIKNEYTTSDITASGGTLLYTSNGTDTTPVYTYVPSTSGTVTMVAFTTDGSGNYSRIESFSKQTQTLTIGTACLN